MNQTSQAIQDKRIQVVSFDLPVVQVGRFVFRFPFELSFWKQPFDEVFWVFAHQMFRTGIPFSWHD